MSNGSEFQGFAIGVLGAAALGLAGSHALLWKSFLEYRTHVAENYLKPAALDPFKKDLDHVKRILTRIADKLHIQAENEA